MRIGVIGSGISGNLVARLLHSEHEVHLFEAANRIGGHSHTVDVEMQGNVYSADVGFMVFNDRTYPAFCELLDRLEIPARDSDMSFSVHCEKTGTEYQGSSVNGLFAQRSNALRPSFHRLVIDVLRFNHLATHACLNDEIQEHWSVRDLLARWGMSEIFGRLYLIPMAAAIWSSVPNQVFEFPARFLVGFFHNHGLLQIRNRPQWKTIIGGSRSYVEALVRPISNNIQLNAKVQRVVRTADHVVVETADQQSYLFDEVVFATHADQTLEMLHDATALEQSILGSFPYQKNQAILHSDERMLPHRKRAWASWNYYVPNDFDLPASVTYDLSRLQGLRSPEPIFLTLNPTQPIDESKIHAHFEFEHPEFGLDSIPSQRRHHEISGHNRSHFCGAYWRNGFHEDGVQSALAVARSFQLDLNAITADSSHRAQAKQFAR